MENNRLNIVFIGTPKFSSIILEKLISTSYKPVLVITAKDKPVGRKGIITPPSVKVTAQKYSIPIEQPEKLKELSLKPDLIILAAYGQIIPKSILDIPKYGAINVHPSLLPKYRGASPIQSAILNGDKETGVTIYFMDEKMDHGKILSNVKYSIPDKITYPELSDNLAHIGADLLISTISQLDKIKTYAQDETKATYTKIIKKEDGEIDWNKPAEEIERQIRAFNPWPGTFTIWKENDKKIKILRAEVRENNNDEQSGKVMPGLIVKCGKDSLAVLELQLEGKKPVSSNDFIKGNNIINSILC